MWRAEASPSGPREGRILGLLSHRKLSAEKWQMSSRSSLRELVCVEFL